MLQPLQRSLISLPCFLRAGPKEIIRRPGGSHGHVLQRITALAESRRTAGSGFPRGALRAKSCRNPAPDDVIRPVPARIGCAQINFTVDVNCGGRPKLAGPHPRPKSRGRSNILQIVMDWEDYHLREFVIRRRLYSVAAETRETVSREIDRVLENRLKLTLRCGMRFIRWCIIRSDHGDRLYPWRRRDQSGCTKRAAQRRPPPRGIGPGEAGDRRSNERGPQVHTRLLSCDREQHPRTDRKSTRLNSSHANISYAVFC